MNPRTGELVVGRPFGRSLVYKTMNPTGVPMTMAGRMEYDEGCLWRAVVKHQVVWPRATDAHTCGALRRLVDEWRAAGSVRTHRTAQPQQQAERALVVHCTQFLAYYEDHAKFTTTSAFFAKLHAAVTDLRSQGAMRRPR